MKWRPILLVGLVLLVYLPALKCGYIWDDDFYVQNNRTVRELSGIWSTWFDIGVNQQYYPLVHSTFWLEYRIWGDAPMGFHAVNVLLHALGAVLLHRVLVRLQVPGAWMVAAIFALHPVQVESVAWITERKNVLSGVFYFAAALLYLRWSGDGASQRGPRSCYYLALAAFTCALLSKTVACSLPAALLLVIWWKRGVVRVGEVARLVPFFAIGAGLSLITVWAEKHSVGAVGEAWSFTPVERILMAGRAPWFYASKLVIPADLTFIYPRWQLDVGAWWQYLFPLMTVCSVVTLFLLRRRLGRGPLVALLCFGGTLFPALGFVDVFPFLYSFVADHFQYLASVGMLALLVATALKGVERLTSSTGPVPVVISVAVLAVLGTLSWRQQSAYRDLESLWRDTIDKNPDAGIAHTNLANVLAHRNEFEAAFAAYEQALALMPDLPEALVSYGGVLLTAGRPREAIEKLERALAVLPDPADRSPAGKSALRGMAHSLLGTALAVEGHLEEAWEHLNESLAREPDTAREHHSMGMIYMRWGRFAEAIEHIERALSLDPDSAEEKKMLAWLLATAPEPALRSPARALALAEEASRSALAAEDPEYYHALAAAHAANGNFDAAVATARRALQVADERGASGIAADIRRSIGLYEQRQPYH